MNIHDLLRKSPYIQQDMLEPCLGNIIEDYIGLYAVIFSVYYKYGEYAVEVIPYKELKSYLNEYSSRYGYEIPEEIVDDSDLIDYCIDIGHDIIRDQRGYGIVSVVVTSDVSRIHTLSYTTI